MALNTPTDFQKFVIDNTLINKWYKYYDDLALRDEFTALLNGTGGSHAKMIKWCERYGDISDEAISLIKHDPKGHINHLMDFPDATHNIAYFNMRRAEMLPPPFRDFGGDGKLYGTHEIDSFIELEILSSGKARASLAHEAGDIIMEGGSLHGLSLDPLGLSHNALPAWNYKFNKEFNKFKGSIDRHFKKIHTPEPGKPPLDKVIIDFKYMDEVNPTLKQQVLDYIQANHQQYNNSTYLIKLNL